MRRPDTSTPSNIQQGRECELLPLPELQTCLDRLEIESVGPDARHAATRTEGRRALAVNGATEVSKSEKSRGAMGLFNVARGID